MLTYPRFAKACYALFAVAVLAAALKLSVSGAEPALLKMLPTVPTASAVEPAAKPPELEDPRLGSFSDDGGAEKLEGVFSRASSHEDSSRAASGKGVLKEREDSSHGLSGAVFRRPSLHLSSSEPVCGDLGGSPRSSRVVFPLPEEYFDSYDDTWGAARLQGGHEGSDLMSPAGTPEFALTDGKLVGVAGSNENGWNRLGGYTVMLEAAYDIGPIEKGDLFYYAHLDRESSLPVGTTVRAGQKIGTVGDTGEGPEVTRGKFPSHLHLGWYDAKLSEERSEAESGAMNPYPLLLWLERNGGTVSGGTDASYCQAPQGPKAAAGEPEWPTPSAPGERPDLDTGEGGDASPAARKQHHHHHHHPKRDDGDRDDEDRSGGAKEEDQAAAPEVVDGTAEAEEPRDEAKQATKSSPRKKPEAKPHALLRDLPSGFDRSLPEHRNNEEKSDDKGGDGRKDGGQTGNVVEDGPRKTDRPDEDRPEGQQVDPPDDTPKAPAPVTGPDRQPRPVLEIPGDDEAGAAEEGPRPDAPPNAVRESPNTKSPPVPDAGDIAVAGEAVLPLEEAVPAPGAIVNALQGETTESPETDEGE